MLYAGLSFTTVTPSSWAKSISKWRKQSRKKPLSAG